jgi:hypothetical protein
LVQECEMERVSGLVDRRVYINDERW